MVLLDLMASRSGLYCAWDIVGFVFYLTETRTYPLHMLNTKNQQQFQCQLWTQQATMGATEAQDYSAIR
ncbi:hypothetical protein [Escherichia coli]|uniref:hypothetical protein n=1 Tax=Escherichia coli TaxID=562 RepID=UPI0024B73862|nr:hypothetical protein [Escherichia coli]WHP23959.1 hypothetical protein QMW19_23525 [Escherichia coli]